ncbi:ATP-binding protein, partial [Streptomyces tateyamensis]|uniref:ATP-binding protein n=1 Tax=Streptomyces tateyamensis TaxID=565073 RepID=UPI001FE3E4FC
DQGGTSEVVARHLLVEVDDAGRNMPVVRPMDEDHIRGRGLALVDALSVAWGCHPRECGIGKTVWAVCPPLMPEVAQQAGGGRRAVSGVDELAGELLSTTEA